MEGETLFLFLTRLRNFLDPTAAPKERARDFASFKKVFRRFEPPPRREKTNDRNSPRRKRRRTPRTKRRKKIKNANRRKTRFRRLRVSDLSGAVSTRRRKKRRRRGDASLFQLTERKNAQRGDASGAEDEHNIHQRVRFAERNTGGEIEEENKENDRRKGRRSDAKEFGHIAVPKGLRR